MIAMTDYIAGERNNSPEQLQNENRLVQALIASATQRVDPGVQGMARLINVLMGNAVQGDPAKHQRFEETARKFGGTRK